MQANYLSHSPNALRQLGALLTIVVGLTTSAIPARGDQPQSKPGEASRARIAVIEFTPGTNASGMTAEGKRQLQSSIAFSLHSSGKFDVVDVRRTRDVTQRDLLELNGPSTAARSKLSSNSMFDTC